MTKIAKPTPDLSWEGRWAQAVVRSLQQLENFSLADADDTLEEQLVKVDEQLASQVVEGLSQSLSAFHGGLNRLTDELAKYGLEQAYDRFAHYLTAAAQTGHCWVEALASEELQPARGRTSLFGVGLLTLASCAGASQHWSLQANEKLAQLLQRHRQVSTSGRLVLLPVGLNVQETADFEPWMGYRLTGLLSQWAQANPTGHPDAEDARRMLTAAGVRLTSEARRVAAQEGQHAKYLRGLTVVGLFVEEPGDSWELEPSVVQDVLDRDFPQANFTTSLVETQQELERVLLALALRQSGSSLGAYPQQAEVIAKQYEFWGLGELQEEAKALSASLDGLRAAHPDLAGGQGQQGFGCGAFAQDLGGCLSRELVAESHVLDVQSVWPATLFFEAAQEVLRAYRNVSFQVKVSPALDQNLKLQAVIDPDSHNREYQVLLQLVGQAQVAAYARWAVLPQETPAKALERLQAALATLGIEVAQSSSEMSVVRH